MISSLLRVSRVILLLLTMISGVFANPVDTYEFKSVDNQQRALALAYSLRCPQCQNQNLVDSNSIVAQDLRLELYKMIDAGKDDDEVIEFMTSRYGEFVLYKPRMEAKTYALWLGPIVLLIVGLLFGFFFIRKQAITELDEQVISAEEQQELDQLFKQDLK